MFTLLIRTVVIYVLVFCVIRLMGKRQISDMQPFDLVITLFIAELASEPISDSGIPLLYGVIPILTLFILHRATAFLALRSRKMRAIVCGHSIIVMDKGIVLEEALKAMNYTLNDLAEQLRLKDVFSFSDVEYAIMETNGSLSVLKKTPSQSARSEPVAVMLLTDGKPDEQALKSSGITAEELKTKLKAAGISNFKDCFFAALEPDGRLHVQLRGSNNAPDKRLYVPIDKYAKRSEK